MKRFMAGVLVAAGLALGSGEAFANEKGQPTAKCKDGTLSYSQSRRGTCSRHGGVAEWLAAPPSAPQQGSAGREQAQRRQHYNDPRTPCGAALRRSVVPLAPGWTEECSSHWPVEFPGAIGLAYFGPNEIKYRTTAIDSQGQWDYVVAHERCHALGIINEHETDNCAEQYGADVNTYSGYR